MSVRTRLSDHTKQTKFQRQRPNDVETPVPSTWVQKCSNIGTVSTWMVDRLMGLCSSYLQGNCWTAVGFRCCITSWGNDPDLRAILLLWQRCLKASQVLGQVKTNKQIFTSTKCHFTVTKCHFTVTECHFTVTKCHFTVINVPKRSYFDHQKILFLFTKVSFFCHQKGHFSVTNYVIFLSHMQFGKLYTHSAQSEIASLLLN
jgi:hypothetical protein